MAGIVTYTTQRYMVGKKIKEVQVPTSVLDLDLFLSDVAKLPSTVTKDTVLTAAWLTSLPTRIKQQSEAFPIPGVYGEGVIYGLNGSTKTIQAYPFSRGSQGTYFDKNGRLQIAAANMPRLAYDPVTLQVMGYMGESASTNLLTNSGFVNGLADLAQQAGDVSAESTLWNKGASLDYGIRLKKHTIVSYGYKHATIDDNLDYVFSFFVRKTDGSAPEIGSDKDFVVVCFNKPALQITIEHVGGGVYRVSYMFNSGSSRDNQRIGVVKHPESSSVDIVCTGFQLEESQASSSYIPTGSAIATRLSDNIDPWILGHSYGSEWDVTVSNPLFTRVGNINMAISLPVQSQMARYVQLENGNVKYWLHPDNSELQADGTPAKLDGTDGDVMTLIPEHYFQAQTNGNVKRYLISEFSLPGFKRRPSYSRGAYEATIHAPTGKMVSVMNSDPDYIGGNGNLSRTDFLGKAATSKSLIYFRGAAQAKGAGWSANEYAAYRSMFWLYMTEYVTRHSQAAFSELLDSLRLRQGGLSPGVTTLSSAQWSGYNGSYPLIPIGVTNKLGNKTGVVPYTIPNFDGDTSVTFEVPSYRGIENPFGHIWEWMDGVLFDVQSGDDGGDSIAYVCVDGNYDSEITSSYKPIGLIPRASGYVADVIFGEEGDLLPLATGGGSSTFWTDYFYTSVPASGNSIRGLLVGGASYNGAPSGLACVNTNRAPTGTGTGIGSRLCFSHE